MVKAKKATRAAARCPLIGSPGELTGRALPTAGDVLRHFKWEAQTWKLQNEEDAPTKKVAQLVAQRVKAVWQAASSVELVTDFSIATNVGRLYERYKKVQKFSRVETESVRARIDTFKEDLKKLFDVAKCKCAPHHSQCICAASKMPPDEEEFLRDQRTVRAMVIGSVDKVATKKLVKQQERQESKLAQAAEAAEKKKGAALIKLMSTKLQALCSKGEGAGDGPSKHDEDWLPEDEDRPGSRSSSSSRPSSGCSSRNSMGLPTASMIAERFNLPSGAAAALITATLVDAGQVTPVDASFVVDRKKLSRQRKKYRDEVTEKDLEKLREDKLRGLYFDGRKDSTKVQQKVGNKMSIVEKVEEHVVLLAEPGDVFVGHVTPEGGDGVSLGHAVIGEVTKKGISTESLDCIGCDGCPTNTGWKGGAVRVIEEVVRRPLQRFVCQLHGNELPLKHLFEQFDGATSGPSSYGGTIGQQLQICLTLPIVKFQKIHLDLPDPDLDSALLSSDQKYTLDMARAISSGEVSEELAARDPGALSHCRWGTTANATMRVYVGTKRPSAALKNITTMIIEQYVPTWFEIKKNWRCTEGAKHVYGAVKRSRGVAKKYREVMQTYIKKNAFFAHPENILLAMVNDDDPEVRRRGLEKIVEARERHEGRQDIRPFVVPELNLQARDYTDLIFWDQQEVTPPPILRQYDTASLKKMLQEECPGKLVVEDFPCHTQAVERHVKMVTEASRTMCREEDREGNIRQKIRSRKAMPNFASKKDFNV